MIKSKIAYLNKINKKLVFGNFILGNLKPNQVLVKLKYTSVCKSQIMEVKGKRGVDKFLPHCLGHEAYGTVIKFGSSVKKFKIGDKVICSWIPKSKNTTSNSIFDINNKKINYGQIFTFGDHVIVNQKKLIFKPEYIKEIDASLFGCAIPTGAGLILNNLKKFKITDQIAVIGAGGVGLSSILTLKYLKYNKIYIFENDFNKIKILKKIGFKKIYQLDKKNLIKFRNYFDYCFETAGSVNTIELGFKIINENKGKLFFASHPDSNYKIKISPHDLIKGKQIIGSWAGGVKNSQDFKKIFEIFKKIKNLNQIFTTKYKFKNINKAISDYEINKCNRPLIYFNG